MAWGSLKNYPNFKFKYQITWLTKFYNYALTTKAGA